MTKSILVAALLAVGLAACGQKEPAATEQKPADATAPAADAPAAAPAAEPAKR
ncbi:MAG: hypothetical protein O2997_05915 [Proteobacteria bacterium]|nr:hypothetical protein [Pseudomonadota bacterium]